MRLALLMSANASLPEGQITSACRLSKVLDATLVGIATSENSLDYYTGGSGSYAIAARNTVAQFERKLESLEVRFEEICKAEGVDGEWAGIYGFMRFHWLDRSAYFDLAVVAPPLSAPELASSGVCGTMQIPDEADFGDFDKRCLIAWDGSLAASRALRASMPLLPRFAAVDVITIDPQTRSLPHDIGAYLASRNLPVNVISEPLAGSTVADLILNEAKTADLLVMGAYGGSELIEKIFGGVTESVHAKCETPILFAK